MRWRDGLLVIVSLVLGPPVAALVAMFGFGIARHGVAASVNFDIQFYVATLPFAYVVAWLPMLIAAVANAVVARLASEPWRLAAALPIGAISFVLQLGWLGEDAAGEGQLSDLFSIGLGGALASVVCVAVIDAFAS